MKKMHDALDRFCSRHPRFGIPNLMIYVVIGNILVYILMMFSNAAAISFLYFDLAGLLRGEIWRIVTFIFVPTASNPLLLVLSLYFYYFIGTAMESYWGTAKFTLFYLTGAVLTVAFAFLSRLWTPLTLVSNVYLNNILFLAFATLYPDALIRFYFVIPVKAKWLALFYAFLTFYDIIRMDTWSVKLLLPSLLPMLVAVWLTYAVFFWDRIREILENIGFLTRHKRSQQPIPFKSAVRQQKKKDAQRGYRHKCAVCGRTDADFPDLEFRYCSRCAGYHCFCQDHIFNHVHFTE